MPGKINDYFIVNSIFAMIIGIALGYSYFFYLNDHPVACIYKQQTGIDCPSCGFSRAFSAFMHFRFEEGKAYNSHALSCFLFLFFQFMFRIGISAVILLAKKHLPRAFIFTEVGISLVLFLLFFLPLLNY